MRYAVVRRPNVIPYLSGRIIGKIENSVATVYLNESGVSFDDINIVTTCDALYEKDGVYLLEYSSNKRLTDSIAPQEVFFYELFLPESHYYFNFGILVSEFQGLWDSNYKLRETMRSDLKELFDDIYRSYKHTQAQ